MRTIKLSGRIDAQHRLIADVPPSVPPGPVEVDLFLPEVDQSGEDGEWGAGIARMWADELSDSREDIYELSDGEPVDGEPVDEAR